MKVACGILALFLLALSNNLISAYVLETNEINNKHFEGPTPVWKLFFDSVSIENDIEHKGILQCFAHYQNKKVEIYDQAKRRIFQCLNISTWIVQKSFEAHFRKYLLHDIKNCKYESDDFASYLECSVNDVIRIFKGFNNERRPIQEEIKFCMHAVVKKFLTDSRENNKELKHCLLGNVCPPTTPSTTTIPQFNTTLNPWDNSTTVSPPVNTTWGYNTTLLPNTTWSPGENTTYPPATVNTTASPHWNTTLNPWDNSTTVSPAVNTNWGYNTTLLPNTTWSPSTPNETTATNDKTTEDSLSKFKPASSWWKKSWGNISSLF